MIFTVPRACCVFTAHLQPNQHSEGSRQASVVFVRSCFRRLVSCPPPSRPSAPFHTHCTAPARTAGNNGEALRNIPAVQLAGEGNIGAEQMQDEVRCLHHLTDVPAPRSAVVGQHHVRHRVSSAAACSCRCAHQFPSPAALPVLPGLLNALLFCPTTQQSWRIVGRALTPFPDFERLPFDQHRLSSHSVSASTRLRF